MVVTIERKGERKNEKGKGGRKDAHTERGRGERENCMIYSWGC